MSSTSAKTAPEIAVHKIGGAPDERFYQDELERRERKIARIGRLWDERKLLTKCAAAGAAAMLLIALTIPSRYASITRLMPPDSPVGQSMAMLAGIAGKMGVNPELLGISTSAELFAGVLESQTVQNDLIEKFDLRKVYGERRLVDARKELSRQTDISIDRKSGILTIQVTDHDPRRASALAREYTAELNNVVTVLNTSSAHRERIFLEERLGQVKDELEVAEKDFSGFASKNAAIDIKEQAKAMVEAVAVLEGQLIAAESELQGLRQIYTDQNIRVRATQARIDELKRQLMKMGGKKETDVSAPLEEGELYPSIRKLPLLGVSYADLYRRMKVEETVFETLTQQYEIAKVQEAKEVPSVKVLDPPEIPEKKVFPPRVVLTLFGGMLGLAIGSFWILGNDHWTKIDPNDPGKILALNMVQSVKPPLQYILQRRDSLFDRSKKRLERWRGASRPMETRL
jgi:capsule polysaccharide export protein KpsE/RkpR